jgi:hypothetical protein
MVNNLVADRLVEYFYVIVSRMDTKGVCGVDGAAYLLETERVAEATWTRTVSMYWRIILWKMAEGSWRSLL